MHPSDYTPRFLVALGADMVIDCRTCRVGRGADLRGPRFAKRLDQPIREMKFRCKACGTDGTASVTWHDSEGKWSYDYGTGQKKSVYNPGVYHT